MDSASSSPGRGERVRRPLVVRLFGRRIGWPAQRAHRLGATSAGTASGGAAALRGRRGARAGRPGSFNRLAGSPSEQHRPAEPDAGTS